MPIISDVWDGIESFFSPGDEILLARSADDATRMLREIDEPARRRIGEAARAHVLSAHTAAHRALELETYARELARA